MSRSRSYPSYLASVQSPIFIAPATNLEKNKTAKLGLVQAGAPSTIHYSHYAPQKRGGKRLNITLVTEPPIEETGGAR